MFLALAKLRPDVNFVAYGGAGGDDEVAHALAEAQQTLPNFIFGGSLHSVNHTAAYCEADVFLTPTRNNEVRSHVSFDVTVCMNFTSASVFSTIQGVRSYDH